MACPVTHAPTGSAGREVAPEIDPEALRAFLRQYHTEQLPMTDPEPRIGQALREVAVTGTYRHTPQELEWACRVAWRNSDRCVGRAGWASLAVRDRRAVRTAAGIAAETIAHVRWSTNGGRIRPAMTVFGAAYPGTAGPRFVGEQVFRYADDPMNLGHRAAALATGWRSSGDRWELLPLLVDADDNGGPVAVIIPETATLEVQIVHPEHPWLADLDLRWYVLPVITSMRMEAGGLWYSAAPFGGWYLETEIAARNLADPERLDMLPTIARGLGLDPTRTWPDWRDRAVVLLNEAVVWSFRMAGVKVSDHRTESARFAAFIDRERVKGRGDLESVDWSWVVPPSACPTPAFHRYYQAQPRTPLPRLVRHR